MSLLGLLNQEITIYPKTGYSADGRESVGAGVAVKGRFQTVSKRNLLPRYSDTKSTVVEVDAIAYIPTGTTIDTDYKVEYSSIKYKVVSVYQVPGRAGTTHHIKLELQKWQSA